MLALIAGEGQLPVHLAHRSAAEGRELQVCELEGFPSSLTYVDGVIRFRVERLGSFLAELKELGVREVVFAGPVRRPKLDPSAVDAETQPLLPRMLAAMQKGDDGALRTLLELFEERGIKVLGAQDIQPELLPEIGPMTERGPSGREEKDATKGFKVLAAMGPADVGQALVASQGQVVAVEAVPGTDWMLGSLRAFPVPEGVPAGGVLVKAPKPGQDRRIDLPTIGPGTITAAAAAGLTGIAIEAGGVMVLDPETCRVRADEAGIALWVERPCASS